MKKEYSPGSGVSTLHMTIDNFDVDSQASTVSEQPNLQYHAESGSFHYPPEQDRWSMSEAVVSAVAVATDRDPIELPPLYEAIDPDALDALVSPLTVHAERGTVTVSFEWADCHVVIEEQSKIRIRASSKTKPR